MENNIGELLNKFEIVPSSYIDRISDVYQKCFQVDNIEKWLKKLEKINNHLEPSRLEAQIKSHCFEIEVINILNQNEAVKYIVYEPNPIRDNGKNCDLLVSTELGNYLIEIKSFHLDRLKRPLDSKYFPKYHSVDLDESVYYDDFTVRSKLINVAVDVEQKIDNYQNITRTALAVQTGFYLNWLRYIGFVYIYKHGCPAYFDYLGKMSMHYITNKSIRYKNTIDEFWSFHESYNGIDEVALVDIKRNGRRPILTML